MQVSLPRPHRAWIILLGLIMAQAGFVGISVNCAGVLFSAILSDTGFRAGDLSLYYTIRSLVAAALITPAVRLFVHGNERLMLACTGILSGAAIGMMSLFTEVWQWYFAGIVAGAGNCLCLLALPIIVNNWFHEKKGFATGMTLASSGIAGALFNPIFSAVIGAFGWRKSALLMMLCVIFLTVIPSVFIIRLSPKACGMEPYGRRTSSEGEKPSAKAGPLPKAPAWMFAGLTFSVLTGFVLVQFSNQMPVFARSIGYAPMIGAALTSVVMIGNVSGKLLFGACSDRFGTYRTTAAALSLGRLSFVLLLFGALHPLMLYAGAGLFGLLYSVSTVANSLLCLDIYGPERYHLRASRISAIAQTAAACSNPLIAYSYDYSGGFQPVLFFGIACCAAAVCIIFSIHAGRKRMQEEGAIPLWHSEG